MSGRFTSPTHMVEQVSSRWTDSVSILSVRIQKTYALPILRHVAIRYELSMTCGLKKISTCSALLSQRFRSSPRPIALDWRLQFLSCGYIGASFSYGCLGWLERFSWLLRQGVLLISSDVGSNSLVKIQASSTRVWRDNKSGTPVVASGSNVGLIASTLLIVLYTLP